jgi:hypothetical protein
MRANDHVAARRHSTWPVRNPRADWLRRNGRGVAADPERLARFRREAQVLASLNHPNIAHVYGLEEATASTAGGQAVHALVMELVEGEDLADRIARGPVPLDETLPIARQIADALEAAHEQGIIHRDLKPANIKVRDDGTVKVLDFGLAKALDPAGDAVSTRRHAPIADSPTITSPVMTQMGVLLGTAAYMSPEQAKCKPADKRSDLWAFGCVLYEMLTGKPAFAGEDLSETLAAVLRAAPDWSRSPLPASLHALLQRCLEKDRQKRVADISTARFVFAEPSLITITSQDRSLPDRRRQASVLAVAVLLAAAATATALRFVTSSPVPGVTTRSIISGAGDAAVRPSGLNRDLAISPDGSKVVYVAGAQTGGRLVVRALDELEPRPLTPGAEAQYDPFFSPDGRWVGFFEGGLTQVTLKKVPITGGPAVTLCTRLGGVYGATWGRDGTIIFAGSTDQGLQRIADGGCDTTLMTRPNRESNEGSYLSPHLLPDGRAVLFTMRSPARPTRAGSIAVFDLRTGTQKTLIQEGIDAHYVPSGHLVYAAAGTLRAVPFDLATLSVTGAAVPVVPQLMTKTSGRADFDIADNGTLVYVTGADLSLVPRTLVWLDRQGREERIAAPARPYRYARLSPDGTQAAFEIPDEDHDIWTLDLARGSLIRVTTDPSPDRMPVWEPDSRHVLFTSNRVGAGRRIFSVRRPMAAGQRNV